MQKILNKYQALGVINVTPNSFSDPGLNFNRQQLKKTLLHFISFDQLIIDVGFESTAPMNDPISDELERERFNIFLELLLEMKLIDKINIISLDTYKLSNIDFFYKKLRAYNPQMKIIFNDVSGVVDALLIEKLKKMPACFYLYSATRIKDRNHVLDHMKNIKSMAPAPAALILNEVIGQFKNIEALFLKHKLSDRLILDCGFGFSKTLEENWVLIDQMEEIFKHISSPLLIGLSKKSFLHKLIDSENPKEDSELIHAFLIDELKVLAKKYRQLVIFRVHDPGIIL